MSRNIAELQAFLQGHAKTSGRKYEFRIVRPSDEWSHESSSGELSTPWGQGWDEWQATKPDYRSPDHQLGYDSHKHAEGKGFILHDGSVWTWPTQDLKPMHMDYSYHAKQRGVPVVHGTAFHLRQTDPGKAELWQYGEGRNLSQEQRQQVWNADPHIWPFGSAPAPEVKADQFGHAQALASWKLSDNYTLDSREWPDPYEPRPSSKPEPIGCTCKDGWKLECPVHGMHPTEESHDYTWSQPESHPVSYPQDAPRSWQQAHSHTWRLADYYHVAPTEDRARIQQHGLQVSDPTWNWPPHPTWGGDPGPHYWGDNRPPDGVYAFPDLERAQSYNTMLEFRRGQPHDIWHIPPEQVQQADRDPDMGGVLVPHNIDTPALAEGPEHREWLPDYSPDVRPDIQGRSPRYPQNDPKAWKERVGSTGFNDRIHVISHSGLESIEGMTDRDNVVASLSLFAPLKHIGPLDHDVTKSVKLGRDVIKDTDSFGSHRLNSVFRRSFKVNPVVSHAHRPKTSNDDAPNDDHADQIDRQPYFRWKRRQTQGNSDPPYNHGDHKQSDTLHLPKIAVGNAPSDYRFAERTARSILHTAKAVTAPIWQSISRTLL